MSAESKVQSVSDDSDSYSENSEPETQTRPKNYRPRVSKEPSTFRRSVGYDAAEDDYLEIEQLKAERAHTKKVTLIRKYFTNKTTCKVIKPHFKDFDYSIAVLMPKSDELLDAILVKIAEVFNDCRQMSPCTTALKFVVKPLENWLVRNRKIRSVCNPRGLASKLLDDPGTEITAAQLDIELSDMIDYGPLAGMAAAFFKGIDECNRENTFRETAARFFMRHNKILPAVIEKAGELKINPEKYIDQLVKEQQSIDNEEMSWAMTDQAVQESKKNINVQIPTSFPNTPSLPPVGSQISNTPPSVVVNRVGVSEEEIQRLMDRVNAATRIQYPLVELKEDPS